MGRNAQDHSWSDLIPAKRQTKAWPPAESYKGGRWVDTVKGGRETTPQPLRSPSACVWQAWSSGTGKERISAHKASGQRMAWRVIQCRPHGHTEVVAFCVSYNNEGGEIRPQARSADGLVRMCLGPGGNVRCLSGCCPATGRRPPVPAEPFERRGSRWKGEPSCSQARLGKEETKDWELGRGLRGTRGHRTRKNMESPFSEESDFVRCLSPT